MATLRGQVFHDLGVQLDCFDRIRAANDATLRQRIDALEVMLDCLRDPAAGDGLRRSYAMTLMVDAFLLVEWIDERRECRVEASDEEGVA